jgi:hypothetical protein
MQLLGLKAELARQPLDRLSDRVCLLLIGTLSVGSVQLSA